MKNLKTVGDAIDLVVARAGMTPPRRHHGRRRRHPARRRRPHAARALDRRASRASPTARAAAATSSPRTTCSMKEIRRADRFTQLAMAAADEALARRRLGRRQLPVRPERIGCVIGTGIGGIGTLEDAARRAARQGAEHVSPLSVPLLMANAAPARCRCGTACAASPSATVSACAAGAHAIGAAARLIQYGDADAVVTGGARRRSRRSPSPPSAAWARIADAAISRPVRRAPRRLRDGRGRRHPGARGGGGRARARRHASSARCSATAPPPTPTT